MPIPFSDVARDLQFLSSMYLCKPTREALKGWNALLADDTSNVWTELKIALQAIDTDSDETLEDVLWDFTRLFIGPYKLPCPPWESVYTSQKRLLMQDAADATRALYAEFGLAIDDSNIMPDHIGAELNFLALVLEEVDKESGSVSRFADVGEKFLNEHLLQWAPRFTQDMEEAAKSSLYKTLARATRNVLESIGH